MAVPVTPVAKTGLHCGELVGAEDHGVTYDVTPVAKTGLHCGEVIREALQQLVGYVTPVAKTGLHCGSGEVAGHAKAPAG